MRSQARPGLTELAEPTKVGDSERRSGDSAPSSGRAGRRLCRQEALSDEDLDDLLRLLWAEASVCRNLVRSALEAHWSGARVHGCEQGAGGVALLDGVVREAPWAQAGDAREPGAVDGAQDRHLNAPQGRRHSVLTEPPTQLDARPLGDR